MKVLMTSMGTVWAGKPNIVVFFADDMGYGDTSLQHPTLSTPHIDKLAVEGVRFTQWYSAFHICSPSRASMMTGRLPIRNGVQGGYQGGVFSSTAVAGLPETEITWAELLQKESYRTMAIGKWHLGQRKEYLPTRRGFESYYGIPYSVDMGRSAWRNISQPPLPLLENETVIEQPVNLNTLSKRYVAKATDFLTNKKDDNSLFALYFAFSHVHVPDFVAPEFCNTTRRGRYGDAMAELDWTLGQVMKAYPSEDVITFFTSDNGPWLVQGLAAGSAGLFFEGKTTTWEGGVRVPGIIHGPGIRPKISQEIVATYDVFATILSVAGVEAPQDRFIDGKDLSPILYENSTKQVRDCVFIYKGTPNVNCPDGETECPGLWAIRCGRYKVHFALQWSKYSIQGSHPVVNATTVPLYLETPLLFDIDADPSEKMPLSSESEVYKSALAMIQVAKVQHEETLEPVVDQVALGNDPGYALCCDGTGFNPNNLTSCACNPENFLVPVCDPVYPGPDTWSGGEWHTVLDVATRDWLSFESTFGYLPW